jgi:hypothetical protein
MTVKQLKKILDTLKKFYMWYNCGYYALTYTRVEVTPLGTIFDFLHKDRRLRIITEEETPQEHCGEVYLDEERTKTLKRLLTKKSTKDGITLSISNDKLVVAFKKGDYKFSSTPPKDTSGFEDVISAWSNAAHYERVSLSGAEWYNEVTRIGKVCAKDNENREKLHYVYTHYWDGKLRLGAVDGHRLVDKIYRPFATVDTADAYLHKNDVALIGTVCKKADSVDICYQMNSSKQEGNRDYVLRTYYDGITTLVYGPAAEIEAPYWQEFKQSQTGWYEALLVEGERLYTTIDLARMEAALKHVIPLARMNSDNRVKLTLGCDITVSTRSWNDDVATYTIEHNSKDLGARVVYINGVELLEQVQFLKVLGFETTELSVKDGDESLTAVVLEVPDCVFLQLPMRAP